MVTTHSQTQPKASDKLLSDRVVLITGASRGIGAATANELAHHGATVGVNYYSSEAAAQQIVDEITSSGGKALAVKADVAGAILLLASKQASFITGTYLPVSGGVQML